MNPELEMLGERSHNNWRKITKRVELTFSNEMQRSLRDAEKLKMELERMIERTLSLKPSTTPQASTSLTCDISKHEVSL